MSYSTNSSNKIRTSGSLLALLFLAGCAGLGEPVISPYEAQSQVPAQEPSQTPQIIEVPAPDNPEFLEPFEAEPPPANVEPLVAEPVPPLPSDEVEPLLLPRNRESALTPMDSCELARFPTGPPVSKDMVIAVFPIDNLSAKGAPIEAMTRLLRTHLKERQFRLVEDRILKRFMRKNRIRHTGRIESRASESIVDGAGADAVLLTSLQTYHEAIPPRVAMVSRLVLVGEKPGIIWMDSVGVSGDEAPGLLDFGRIDLVSTLVEKSIQSLVESLEDYLPKTGQRVSQDQPYPCQARSGKAMFSRRDPRLDDLPPFSQQKAKRKHRPKTYFVSPILDYSRRYRVAVIPFLNLSTRKNAGSIVTLDFVNQLRRSEPFTVIEPGLVSEQLFRHRVIMRAGPSFAAESLIASKGSLGADLVFAGTIFDYQDAVGVPKIDFSINVYDGGSGQVVWTSRSYNHGEEGVFFFDAGRYHTAHALNLEMIQGTFDLLSAR